MSVYCRLAGRAYLTIVNQLMGCLVKVDGVGVHSRPSDITYAQEGGALSSYLPLLFPPHSYKPDLWTRSYSDESLFCAII